MRLPGLLAIAFIFFTSSVSADAPKTKTEQYRNNIVTYEYEYDTVCIKDPESGEIEELHVTKIETMLLNQKPVFSDEETLEPAIGDRRSDLEGFIKCLWEKELCDIQGLTGDFYTDIVIDENGKLAYFQPDVYCCEELRHSLANILCSMETKLEELTFVPATREGRLVPYALQVAGF